MIIALYVILICGVCAVIAWLEPDEGEPPRWLTRSKRRWRRR